MVKQIYYAIMVIVSVVSFSGKALGGNFEDQHETLYSKAMKFQNVIDRYVYAQDNIEQITAFLVEKKSNNINYLRALFFRDLQRSCFNVYLLKWVVINRIPGWNDFAQEILAHPKVPVDLKNDISFFERYKKNVSNKFDSTFINYLVDESIDNASTLLMRSIKSNGINSFQYIFFHILFFHKDWQVKIYKTIEKEIKVSENAGFYRYGVLFLAGRKEKYAIFSLIQLLKEKRYMGNEYVRNRRTIGEFALNELRKVTGRNYGNSYAAWASWWARAEKMWKY